MKTSNNWNQISLEQNKIYKQQKKLELAQKKKDQMIQKRMKQLEEKREKFLKEMKEKAQQKYEKNLEKYLKDQNRRFEKLKRQIEWKKPLKRLEKKKDETKSLKKKLYELVQKYARLRDSDQYWWWHCISCWKRVRWDKADGGHYISRANMSTAFNPYNIHLQCKGCNWMLWWNIIEFRKNLVKKIGEAEVLKLEKMKNQVKHRTKEELEIEIAYYENKVQELLDYKEFQKSK